MKIPQFLLELMSTPTYTDKDSREYAMVEKYLNLLYPGKVQTDTTGRITEPEYDMTLEQFNDAQREMDAALEEFKQEAEEEYKETGQHIDIDDYVELEETIDVRVLMPWGAIENKQLEVYSLDLPEDDDDTPNDKPRRVWRWHAEEEDNTCDECASRNGETYYSEDDIPEISAHPNCRCTITEDLIDSAGNTLLSKLYSPKKTAIAPEQQEKIVDTPTGKATFEKPANTIPGYYAVFDGKKFTLYVNNKPVLSWNAVSGQSKYQNPEYQNMEFKGPIPEGTYIARYENLQYITPIGFMAGLIPKKHGEWPGSIISWGKSRVWLEPSKETNTYGRDRFSIHGGWIAGSAGCIDLTFHMKNFVALFDFIGKDLIVNVRY